MPGDVTLPSSERAFLLDLQRQALRYFLDNHVPGGLVRDRQANHQPLRSTGWYSTSATGRVRRVFHSLPCVMVGLQRLGFTCIEEVGPPSYV